MRQSFKYRLYPNRQQPRIIDDILGHCRLLYHRLLAEHKDAYKKSGTTLSYMAQANSFPARKQAIPRAFASAARCRLVNVYGLIALEALNAQGLLKNHHLAKSIADAGWHQLVQITEDKAARAGRRVVLVDPGYTSQDCSTPDGTYRTTDLTLADRTWQCPNCGTTWHRDVHAARNIRQRAVAS